MEFTTGFFVFICGISESVLPDDVPKQKGAATILLLPIYKVLVVILPARMMYRTPAAQPLTSLLFVLRPALHPALSGFTGGCKAFLRKFSVVFPDNQISLSRTCNILQNLLLAPLAISALLHSFTNKNYRAIVYLIRRHIHSPFKEKGSLRRASPGHSPHKHL